MMLQPLCRRDKLMVWDDLMELLRVELKHRQTYLYMHKPTLMHEHVHTNN